MVQNPEKKTFVNKYGSYRHTQISGLSPIKIMAVFARPSFRTRLRIRSIKEFSFPTFRLRFKSRITKKPEIGISQRGPSTDMTAKVKRHAKRSNHGFEGVCNHVVRTPTDSQELAQINSCRRDPIKAEYPWNLVQRNFPESFQYRCQRSEAMPSTLGSNR